MAEYVVLLAATSLSLSWKARMPLLLDVYLGRKLDYKAPAAFEIVSLTTPLVFAVACGKVAWPLPPAKVFICATSALANVLMSVVIWVVFRPFSRAASAMPSAVRRSSETDFQGDPRRSRLR